MSLHKWDKAIRPCLESIRSHAHWLSYHARGIDMALRMLPARPAWPTEAQDALREVQNALEAALADVRLARERYEELAVMIDDPEGVS